MACSESQSPSSTLFLLLCLLFAVRGTAIYLVARARNLNDIFDLFLYFKFPLPAMLHPITQFHLFWSVNVHNLLFPLQQQRPKVWSPTLCTTEEHVNHFPFTLLQSDLSKDRPNHVIPWFTIFHGSLVLSQTVGTLRQPAVFFIMQLPLIPISLASSCNTVHLFFCISHNRLLFNSWDTHLRAVCFYCFSLWPRNNCISCLPIP